MAAREKSYCGFCSEEITSKQTRHYLEAHGIDLLNKVCARCGEEFRAKSATAEYCAACVVLHKKDYNAQYRLTGRKSPKAAVTATAAAPVSFAPLGCEGCERVERGGKIYWYRDGLVVKIERELVAAGSIAGIAAEYELSEQELVDG